MAYVLLIVAAVWGGFALYIGWMFGVMYFEEKEKEIKSK